MPRPTHQTSHRSSILILVAAGLCWGTGGVTGRALADVANLSASAVATYRLVLGGGLLVIALLCIRRYPSGRAAWLRVGVVAVLSAISQACYFAAVVVSSVPLATLMTIGSAPILVVVATALTRRQTPGWPVARPVIIGLCGLLLLVGAPSGNTLAETLAGAALSALSGASFAALTVLGRNPVTGLNDVTCTGYGFALGGVALGGLTTVSAGTIGALSISPTPSSVGLLVLLATIPTAVAYSLYFRGLRGSTAATATLVALLEPLTGTVLAAVLLGQTLTRTAALGAVLLLGSVLDTALSHVRGQPRPSTPRPHRSQAP